MVLADSDEFLVFRRTQETEGVGVGFDHYRAVTFFVIVPTIFNWCLHPIVQSYNPKGKPFGLGSSVSLMLLRESIFLSLPAATEMFQFLRLPLDSYVFTGK